MIYLAQLIWDKPVLTLYRDRRPIAETMPLAVVQATQLTVTTSEKKTLEGTVDGFFALMGNLDYVSFKGGATDKYVLCWFDYKADDFIQGARRLTGVSLSPDMSYTEDERGKRTYKTTFTAEFGKLE
jgi:hypothetical protein